MIGLSTGLAPMGTQVWLAAGVTDMRKSFDGLAALVQQSLGHSLSTCRVSARSSCRRARTVLTAAPSWLG